MSNEAEHIIKNLPIYKFLPPGVKPPLFWGAQLAERVAAETSSQKAFYKSIEHLRDRIPVPSATPDTRLGIEIEVENMGNLPEKFKFSPWVMKNDGSLRNHGVEFISVPVRPQDVPLSLAVLYSWFQKVKAQPDFSWRTSTHVHVEANRLTIEQFRRMLLLYLVFEESLFEFGRPGRRETNIFCTPLSRTDTAVLRPVFQTKSWEDFVPALKLAGRSIQKYSALNLSHMFGYGTIEFRHLGGEPVPEKIALWVSLLMGLYDSAQRLDTEYLTTQIKELNTNSTYRGFSQMVFGPAAELLANGRPDLFLSRGVTLCKELLSETKIPKRTPKIGLELFAEAEVARAKKDPLAGEPPPPDRGELEEVRDTGRPDIQPPGTPWNRRIDLHRNQPTTAFNPMGVTPWVWCTEQASARGIMLPSGSMQPLMDEFVMRTLGTWQGMEF